jgi:threonine dehydratase
VISSPRLSEAVGCEVTVVTEAFQHTGSFKFRAAWQVASNVPNPGILTSSSGNLKVEPTGALSLAALLTEPERFRGRRVGCVVSGGNVDPAVYIDMLREEH